MLGKMTEKCVVTYETNKKKIKFHSTNYKDFISFYVKMINIDAKINGYIVKIKGKSNELACQKITK